MKKINVKEVIIITVSLVVICAISSVLLALTNNITKDKIAALAVEKENATKSEVLADAEKFSDAKTVSLNGTDYTYYDGLSSSGEVVGYVFAVAGKGYGGNLRIMVGIGSDGKVKGVSPLELNETAGLGMKAQNEDFLNQYNGKSAGIGVAKNSPASNEIQALTGATITSKAVTNAVNTAFELMNTVKGGWY
ncbi:MAG: RnfABCDGE type electron transport complex subunit G [Clostridiales bacterium]|nr:RnfABCDGE type electron transport complex subunit G [Clostridiales bacterium]